MSISDIVESLLRTRSSYDRVEFDLPDHPGVYAVFLAGRFPAQNVLRDHAKEGPLYIGKTERGLRKRLLREHFADCKTGRSALRRSLSATLRSDLNLRPIRRGTSSKNVEYQNFKLDSTSERALTGWMKETLAVGWWGYVCDRPLKNLEAEVIVELNPPLNSRHSSHPLVATIDGMRAECRELARHSTWEACP